jgi:formate/nitrite transporter FocA (FNT family)
LLIKNFDPEFITEVGDKVPQLDILTWSSFFFKNLVPVTIGNIIGGTVLVAAIYWFAFQRGKKSGI